MSALLEEALGTRAEVYMGESVFLVHLKIKCALTSDELRDKAAANGLLVFPIHKGSKKMMALPISRSPAAKSLWKNFQMQ